MRFVLEVWPDLPPDTAAPDLLAWAVDSIKSNPHLVWDIYDDSGMPVATDVSLLDELWAQDQVDSDPDNLTGMNLGED